MAELTREQLLTAIIAGRGPAYLRGVNLSSLDLSKAGWLIGADLRQADLSGANLSRSNLKDALLEKANLHSANLSGANLEGADLRAAKLTVANLSKANLRGANLEGANLVGANLTQVNLEGASVEGADLEGANLQGANLVNTKLRAANLKMAKLQGANLQLADIFGSGAQEEKLSDSIPIPPHAFAGMIHNIQLMDFIQIACLSRSNLLIRIESSQGHGTIHVRSGRVYHAQMDKMQGEAAFFEMLCWENGRFETLPSPAEGIASIDKPLEHLLVESMRQRDEKMSSSGRI